MAHRAGASASTTARSARAPAASSCSRWSGCSATTSSRRRRRPGSPTGPPTWPRCCVFVPQGAVLWKVGLVMGACNLARRLPRGADGGRPRGSGSSGSSSSSSSSGVHRPDRRRDPRPVGLTVPLACTHCSDPRSWTSHPTTPTARGVLAGRHRLRPLPAAGRAGRVRHPGAAGRRRPPEGAAARDGPSRLHLDLHVDRPGRRGRPTPRRSGHGGRRHELGYVVDGVAGRLHVLLRVPPGEPGRRTGRLGRRPTRLVDQVCLDVPAPAYETECGFWQALTGWELRFVGELPEFRRLIRPPDQPLQLLLQRLDEQSGPVARALRPGRQRPAGRDRAASRARAPRSCEVGDGLDGDGAAGRSGLLHHRPLARNAGCWPGPRLASVAAMTTTERADPPLRAPRGRHAPSASSTTTATPCG